MRIVRHSAVVTLCVVAACSVAIAAKKPSDAEKSFNRLLADRIGRLWYARMEAHPKQLLPGTIRVQLAISRGGKIVALRVLSNTSSELLAKLSLDAIKQAKIPPVPSEIHVAGTFKREYTFTVYPR
jgi:outer membrane biosynthesis protein TonB